MYYEKKLSSLNKLVIYALGAIILIGGVLFLTWGKGTQEIDPDFKVYYQSFLKEASKRGFGFVKKQDFKMEYGKDSDFKQKTLGFCFLIIGKTPSIKIDKQKWNRSSDVQKEMIVFHELAHCLLVKGHSKESHLIHRSLMVENIFSDVEYLAHREQYLDELFSYKPYHVKETVVSMLLEPMKKNWSFLFKLF